MSDNQIGSRLGKGKLVEQLCRFVQLEMNSEEFWKLGALSVKQRGRKAYNVCHKHHCLSMLRVARMPSSKRINLIPRTHSSALAADDDSKCTSRPPFVMTLSVPG